jgi:hypothetical protein
VIPGLASAGVAAVLLTAVAMAVHTALPRFARTRPLFAHALLAGTGIACGAIGFLFYSDDPSRAVLSALIGFGVVHVPAGFILALKAWGRRRAS